MYKGYSQEPWQWGLSVWTSDLFLFWSRESDIWAGDLLQPARYQHHQSYTSYRGYITSTAYLWVENITKANGLDVRMVSPCLYCFTADIVRAGGYWWRWWRTSYHGRDTLNTGLGLLTIPGLEAAQVYRVRPHPHVYTSLHTNHCIITVLYCLL